MAKVGSIIGFCVLVTALVLMIIVEPIEASISCEIDAENCKYCCNAQFGTSWKVFFKFTGGRFSRGKCKCSSPEGDQFRYLYGLI